MKTPKERMISQLEQYIDGLISGYAGAAKISELAAQVGIGQEFIRLGREMTCQRAAVQLSTRAETRREPERREPEREDRGGCGFWVLALPCCFVCTSVIGWCFVEGVRWVIGKF